MLKIARERDFKDKYGKHRRTFDKPPEPPGYWNMEWESSQQERENNEEVDRIERVKVQERYGEALKNGAWVFADEMKRPRR